MPDLTYHNYYDVCDLSSSYKQATVSDLLRLNKVIDLLSKNVLMLRFPRLQQIDRCQIGMFSDASFANLPDGGTQGAIIVFLKDEKRSEMSLVLADPKIEKSGEVHISC